MSSGELLAIDPAELRFPFELRKQISCTLHLSNKTDEFVAFKVKTTSPKKYCVRPNSAVVLPRSTCAVVVTMQAQREAPPDMLCKDKFLVQCVVARDGATAKDVTSEMFAKESGNLIHEIKMRAAYVARPQPPSPVREGSEEGSSPRASTSENGNLEGLDFGSTSKSNVEPQEESREASALIFKLTGEKNSAIQQNNKLRQELELLRSKVGKEQSCNFSFMFVAIIALLGILLGYLIL